MPTAFKIVISKAIIEQSKYCGTNNDVHTVGSNCAIATVLADFFPDVYVTGYHIFPYGMKHSNEPGLSIPLPLVAKQFIKLFDGFYLTPKLRLLLPEFEFIIDIPDEVIEQINIDEVKALIAGGNKISNGHTGPISSLYEPSLF